VRVPVQEEPRERLARLEVQICALERTTAARDDALRREIQNDPFLTRSGPR